MNSRSFAARCLPQMLLLVAWFGLTACGTSSTLYVTQDLEHPLDAKSATVVTTGNGVKLSKAARVLKEMLVKRLKQSGLFDRVGSDGDIIIRATIQNMDDGKQVGRALSLKGKAEVTVEVKISKPNGTRLADVTASADSSRKNDEDRPDLRVLRAAADQIVQYLKEHRGESKEQGEDKKSAKSQKQ